MKYFHIFVLLLLSYLISCVNPPDIHIGRTFFADHNIDVAQANALDTIAQSAVVEMSGVYWFFPFAADTFPAVIRLNARDQLLFALLSDSLHIRPGDYIDITGVPFDTLLPLGFSYTQEVSMLRMQNFKLKYNTHTVLSKAQADYSAFKNELQRMAKQPGSKLIWPDEPQWQLFIDEKRSKVIAWFSEADLMYALDVNVVYDLQDYEIEDIYAREWFKGE